MQNMNIAIVIIVYLALKQAKLKNDFSINNILTHTKGCLHFCSTCISVQLFTFLMQIVTKLS